jgi:hypothetical protein
MGRAGVVRQLRWGTLSRRGRGSEQSELGRELLPVGEEGEWVNRLHVLEKRSALSRIERRGNDS